MVSLTEVLPAALRDSGLTVAALARRAGVSRASVSEYLHGHRQPGLRQVDRLVTAAGLRAEVRLRPDWAGRQAQLEDVLELADALPQRRRDASTRTWSELVGR